MNTFVGTGRFTAHPELKKTTSGKSVCSFTLAVKRPMTKDTTDFLNFVVWNQGAEYLCKFGNKGNVVAVCGKLTSRNYEDKDGNKRTAFEVVADTVELIGGQKTEEKTEQKPVAGGNDVEFEEIGDDEELPF